MLLDISGILENYFSQLQVTSLTNPQEQMRNVWAVNKL